MRPQLILALTLLLTACIATLPVENSGIPTPAAPPAQTDIAAASADSTSDQTPPSLPAAPETESTPEAAACAEADIRQLAESIAEDYPFTNGQEVLTWFCEGAEFEDILLALESEDLSGTPAEEMLAMLAEGLTWEEIWLVIGLTEE